MLTIFTKATMDFISDQLTALIGIETQKTEGFWGLVNTKELTQKQIALIKELNTKVLRYECTGNDGIDQQGFKNLVDEYITKLAPLRAQYNQYRDSGKCMDTLNAISRHIKGFYDRLKAFKFNLLNLVYDESSPELIVDFFAAFYLGTEIFKPESYDETIRLGKEAILEKRLPKLQSNSAKAYTLKDRVKEALDALDDIDRDNRDVVSKKPGWIPEVELGFFTTVKVKSESLNSSAGRLGEAMELARTKIKELLAKQLQEPAEPRELSSSSGSARSAGVSTNEPVIHDDVGQESVDNAAEPSDAVVPSM